MIVFDFIYNVFIFKIFTCIWQRVNEKIIDGHTEQLYDISALQLTQQFLKKFPLLNNGKMFYASYLKTSLITLTYIALLTVEL